MGIYDVAANIRDARRKLGISRSELARRIHYTRPAVLLFERGDRLPRLEALDAIARELGVPVVDLLADRKEKKE